MASFDSLDDTLLEQVLLRCRARDFPALDRTCRRFHSVVESQHFRTLRMDQDWVEVKTIIEKRRLRTEVDGEEFSFSEESDGGLYSYDYISENSITLVVDHRKAGIVSFALVTRPFSGFYDVCDEASADLECVAATFFDPVGGISKKVPSVWKAVTATEEEAGDSNGFLYISSITWKDEYKSCSLVGAKALRSILLDSALKEEWSVCIYIPESREANAMIRASIDEFENSARPTYPRAKEQYDRRQALYLRRKELVAQDARHFLRAGFVQAQETVATKQCIHLFAVPSFLKASVLTEDDTHSIPLHQPEQLRLVDQDFLRFVVRQCTCTKGKEVELEAQSVARQQLQESVTECNAYLEAAKEAQDEIGEADRAGPTEDVAGQTSEDEVLKVIEAIESQLSALSTIQQEVSENIVKIRDELESLLRHFSEEVVKYKNAGAEIGSSHVIHACAFNVNAELIDALLNPLATNEVQRVINSLDQDGMTPLMRAALTSKGPTSARLQTITRLFDFGADKNIVDEEGHTALGKFRIALSDHQDEIEVDPSLSARIQALLMPTGGPTLADNVAVGSDEDHDDIMLDEDDMLDMWMDEDLQDDVDGAADGEGDNDDVEENMSDG